jgi:hypothetical protein
MARIKKKPEEILLVKGNFKEILSEAKGILQTKKSTRIALTGN